MKPSIPLALAVAVLAAGLLATLTGCATEFVVDRAHLAADDANPGSPDKPFKTIAAAVAEVQPGDTVTVKAGTYAERVTITASGTKGKPVTLRAARGQRVVIDGDGKHGITWAPGAGHLAISGFEVRNTAGAARHVGIGSSQKGGHHVTISDCVLVGSAIRLIGHSDCTIRHCVQTGAKGNGVSLSGCTRCTVEECEIFANGADGIVVTHGSDACKVLRNTVTNHWHDSHPDGIQVYRTVTNFLVEGNLFFNSGQGFMLEETDRGVFRNNVIAGTHHSGIILGHKSSHNWTVEQNTIAYTAFNALVFSGKGTVIRNNVILTGGDSRLIRQAGPDPCVSDHNLLWKPDRRDVIYNVPEGQGAHSRFADPKFRSAPSLTGLATYYIDVWGDKEAAAKCTPGKLYLIGRPLTSRFAVGDHVEANFDGRPRKVTEVTDEYVAFAPPLDKLHHHPWDVLVNWKDKTDFTWDLRLADDSPGRKMGDKGQDVGSCIDIQAYLKGDFNGDGRRDLPAMPGKPPAP